MQVFERLITDWCVAVSPGPQAQPGSDSGLLPRAEKLPGFRRFAMEQLGGEACIAGLLRAGRGGPGSGLDARDAVTQALLGGWGEGGEGREEGEEGERGRVGRDGRRVMGEGGTRKGAKGEGDWGRRGERGLGQAAPCRMSGVVGGRGRLHLLQDLQSPYSFISCPASCLLQP